MKSLSKTLLFISLFLSIGCGEESVSPEKNDYTAMKITAKISHCEEAYAETGSIDITIEGGEKPFLISWTNGATTEDINNLKSGYYTVEISDNSGRRAKEKYYVEEPTEATVTDIEGNVYKTIKIGEQWWMAEDLRVTKNNKGEGIQSYIYEDKNENLDKYGRLYDWNTAMNNSKNEGTQGIAPDGWHIPTKIEWEELFNKLGGMSSAGGQMKENNSEYWNSPNKGATNKSKFCSRGSGERAGANESYVYQFLKKVAVYWSSNEGTNLSAYYYVLSDDKESVREILFHKDYAYSVRCIKNK